LQLGLVLFLQRKVEEISLSEDAAAWNGMEEVSDKGWFCASVLVGVFLLFLQIEVDNPLW
jgi:hypothetical protein